MQIMFFPLGKNIKRSHLKFEIRERKGRKRDPQKTWKEMAKNKNKVLMISVLHLIKLVWYQQEKKRLTGGNNLAILFLQWNLRYFSYLEK